MLQIIREKLTGWVAIVLLGAVALTLVISFGNIDTGFSAGQPAASVNGEDIPLSEFRRIYDQQRRQWEQAYRAELPDELAATLADSAIQTLVNNQVVTQYVEEQGYYVNDTDIIQAIEQNQAFAVGGRFSRAAYADLLRSQGLSEQRYELDMRRGMQINQFVDGIGLTAFYTPAEFRRYIELDGERRKVEYLQVSVESRMAGITVSDEQVGGYYEANPTQFQTEEAATLDFIEVDYNQLLAATQIDEADARAYYDDNPAEFIGPEERLAAHILIGPGADEQATAAFADELYARIQSGEDFEVLAKEYSDDTGTADSGGEIGWLGAGDTPAQEFEDQLFALEPGAVSEPVSTEFGIHIIKLDGIREGASRGFDEVREELLTRLKEDVASDAYADILDELDDRALESLDGLAPVAEAMELPLGRVDEFTRSGGLPLGFSSQLVDTVFSLEVLEDGENSPIIELDDGRAVVVQVVEHRLPELKPLAEVSDTIRQQLVTEAAVAGATEAGAELLAELNAGVDAGSLAAELGVSWTTVDAVRRGAEELPADLTAAIFRAPKQASDDVTDPPYRGMELASGGYAIYRVIAVEPGQADVYSLEDRDLRKQQLAQQLGSAQTAALVDNLVSDASIRITRDLLGTQSDL